MIAPLILSIVLWPIIYYILKVIAKKRGKKSPNKSMVLIYSFILINILWIMSFVASFFVGGDIASEVTFVFIGIPILIIIFGLLR